MAMKMEMEVEMEMEMEMEEITNPKPKNLNDLPLEVLAKIFEFLNVSDVQVASLVCKRWYEVSNCKKFQLKTLLNISYYNIAQIYLKDTVEPITHFLNSNRLYYNLKVNVNRFDCPEFFTKFGQSLQSLEFCEELEMRPNTIFKIFETLKNPLKELIMVECIVSADYDDFVNKFSKYCDEESKEIALSKLEKLDINFNNLTKNKPNKSITNEVFMKILTKNHATLKSIKLNNNKIIQYKNFLDIWKTLKLEEIHFNYTFRTRWNDYKKLLFLQPSLKILNLSNFINISSTDYYLLAKSLKFITRIVPQFGTSIDADQDLKYLLEMKNLRNHDVNHISFDNLNPDNIVEDLGKKINNHVQELKLGSRLFTDYQMQTLMLCYPNLINLNISVNYVDFDQVSIITDGTIQLIIKNLKLLRYLNIQGHKLITDYALTGIDMDTNEKTGHSIDQLNGLLTLNLDGCEKLTDFTLITSLKFLELRTLILKQNPNYTSLGVTAVVKNCPSLENLIYSTAAWEYLEVIKTVRRLKSFHKICKKCREEDNCQVKSVDFEQILQPQCYKGCAIRPCTPPPGMRCWLRRRIRLP